MATHTKPTQKVQEFYSNMDLDGVLTTSVRAKLVVEFLKYVLYQRQQIPLTHDQILSSLNSEQKKQNEDTASSGRQNIRSRIESRKQEVYIDSMTNIATTLEHAFAHSFSIRRVLIILGSTIVSPKECYLMHFPTSIHDGKVLSLKQCKVMFFQKLLSSQFFTDVPQPKSCGRVHILLEMPENASDEFSVEPKPTFSIPKRGKHLVMNFICHSHEVSGEISRLSESHFDISGVEPLNHSLLDHRRLSTMDTEDHLGSPFSIGSVSSESSMEMATPHVCTSPMATESAQDLTDCMDICTNEHCQYMWYQLPTSLQGFKAKSKCL